MVYSEMKGETLLRYITFCEMTTDFLKKPLDERKEFIPKWSQTAKKYGIKLLFWGMPMGVNEHIVLVFETNESGKYFMFQREWLGLGTEEAGKYIKKSRTVTVY
ncbi:hypothetical protein GF326_02435 [Candidatus Bathyarchaeota archaeon]|nr:hypothetical protein [Candidatus Bathyarchaeota archaeon]